MGPPGTSRDGQLMCEYFAAVLAPAEEVEAEGTPIATSIRTTAEPALTLIRNPFLALSNARIRPPALLGRGFYHSDFHKSCRLIARCLALFFGTPVVISEPTYTRVVVAWALCRQDEHICLSHRSDSGPVVF